MVKEDEIILTKNQASYDLPDDFDRMLSDTWWDRVESRPVTPLNAQQWQEFKSGLVNVAIWKQMRIKPVDGVEKIFINPTPTTTQCEYECRDGKKTRVGLAYEYYTKYAVMDTNGDPKERITATTDTFLIPDAVLEADLKWRWLRTLGRQYLDEKMEAEEICETMLAQKGTPSKLVAHGNPTHDYPNIPETGVGL